MREEGGYKALLSVSHRVSDLSARLEKFKLTEARGTDTQ